MAGRQESSEQQRTESKQIDNEDGAEPSSIPLAEEKSQSGSASAPRRTKEKFRKRKYHVDGLCAAMHYAPQIERELRELGSEREAEVLGAEREAVATITDRILMEMRSTGKLEQENAEGLVEYKLKLTGVALERLKELTTQMKFRLNEGRGFAVYVIGVSDDGELIGLDHATLVETLCNLYEMASAVDADVRCVHCVLVKEHKMAVSVVVQQKCGVLGAAGDGEAVDGRQGDVRVALLGIESSGKSSLVGALTSGELDNGRGLARMRVFRHRHEVLDGRTSSIGWHVVGVGESGSFIVDDAPFSILSPAGDSLSRCPRFFTFIDLAGHSRYIKSTLQGLINCLPDYAMLVVAANTSIQRIPLILQPLLSLVNTALGLPVIIVVTKCDTVDQQTKKNVVDAVARLLFSRGLGPIAVSSDSPAPLTPGRRASPAAFPPPQWRLSSRRRSASWPRVSRGTDSRRRGVAGRMSYEDGGRPSSSDPSSSVDAVSMIGTSTPIFELSAVTGENLSVLSSYLAALPSIVDWQTYRHYPAAFRIEEIYEAVEGVGLVVGGLLLSGVVRQGDILNCGPVTSFGEASVPHHQRQQQKASAVETHPRPNSPFNASPLRTEHFDDSSPSSCSSHPMPEDRQAVDSPLLLPSAHSQKPLPDIPAQPKHFSAALPFIMPCPWAIASPWGTAKGGARQPSSSGQFSPPTFSSPSSLAHHMAAEVGTHHMAAEVGTHHMAAEVGTHHMAAEVGTHHMAAVRPAAHYAWHRLKINSIHVNKVAVDKCVAGLRCAFAVTFLPDHTANIPTSACTLHCHHPPSPPFSPSAAKPAFPPSAAPLSTDFQNIPDFPSLEISAAAGNSQPSASCYYTSSPSHHSSLHPTDRTGLHRVSSPKARPTITPGMMLQAIHPPSSPSSGPSWASINFRPPVLFFTAQVLLITPPQATPLLKRHSHCVAFTHSVRQTVAIRKIENSSDDTLRVGQNRLLTLEFLSRPQCILEGFPIVLWRSDGVLAAGKVKWVGVTEWIHTRRQKVIAASANA